MKRANTAPSNDDCCCECCGCSCGCGCCGGSEERGFKRRYQTKAEQVAELSQYLQELKNEVQAVEEQLADLKL